MAHAAAETEIEPHHGSELPSIGRWQGKVSATVAIIDKEKAYDMTPDLGTKVREEPRFFAKEFVEDMAKLGNLDDSRIESIREWLSARESYEALTEPEAWVELSGTLSISIDELQHVLGPIALLASFIAERDLDANAVIDQLIQAGPLKSVEAPDKLRTALHSLMPPLVRMARVADETTSPSLPLLYVRGIRACPILVPEFKDTFDPNHDDIAKYHPRIKRLHARITLELALSGLKTERVGIVLTPDSLKELRQALDVAETEMSEAKTFVEKRK